MSNFDNVYSPVLTELTAAGFDVETAQDTAHDYATDVVYGRPEELQAVRASYQTPEAKLVLDDAGFSAPNCEGIHTNGTRGIWATCTTVRPCRSCSY